jgi:hypothetical protein
MSTIIADDSARTRPRRTENVPTRRVALAPHVPLQLVAAEASVVLRATPWRVVKACRSGRLRASKPGQCWLIDEAAIVDYIAAHSNTQGRS